MRPDAAETGVVQQGPRATQDGPFPLGALRARTYPALVFGGLVAQIGGLVVGLPVLAAVGAAIGGSADVGTAGTPVELRGRLRRAGLGSLQRTSVRAILLLAALAPHSDQQVAAAYGFAVAALIALARADQVLVRWHLSDTPPLAMRNLVVAPDHGGTYLSAQRRAAIGVNLFAGLEVPLAFTVAAVTLGAVGTLTAVVVHALVVVAAAVVVAATARRVLRFRRGGERGRYLDGLRQSLVDHGAEYVVYFSGDADATYQLNQWVDVFERIDEPILYLLREHVHEREMKPTRWPVLVCSKHADVEIALAADPKVALYVATAGRNIHFLRYGSMQHVFLNHGDSDKISSANPVVKVYDQLFVAGQVAIDRYRAAGIDLPDDRFRIVGRPQLDGLLTDGERVGDGPPTVLYAPTWEGYFASADYSSLERQGVDLVTELLAYDGDIRVVFKPHPMSGTVRPAAARARRSVEELLHAAGEPHLVARDFPDIDLLGWFDRSDVLVADVSAVITDYLATGKPYLVTNPRALTRKHFENLFPSHTAAYFLEDGIPDVRGSVRAALTDDHLSGARAARRSAVLGDHDDGPLPTFVQAMHEAKAAAERDRGRSVDRFTYGSG